MAVDVNAYAKELMDEAGISDAEQRKQLDAFFGNEKVRAKFTNVLTEATEGVSRERGRTAAEKQRADKAVADSNAYYQSQLKLANDNKAVVDAAQATVNRYVELYGELPGGGNPNNPVAVRAATQDVIDKKTFDERIGRTESLTVSLVKDAARITARHLKTYNEEPDFDAIEKIATEQGLNAMKAYEVWTAPKAEERSKAQVEADKKAAVEAALLEDRSKRGISQVADAQPKSEFMTNLARQAKPSSAEDSFIKGWREPEPAKVSKQEFGRT